MQVKIKEQLGRRKSQSSQGHFLRRRRMSCKAISQRRSRRSR